MSTSVGQIGLDLVVNQNQFNRQMGGIQSIAKKAGATLAAAFSVKKLIDFGKQCIDVGSDLQEVQNVVDVTFPKMSAKVNEFSRNVASSYGLSETMAKKFTGTFGSMAKAFGFTEGQAYDMGATLTGLAGDVASFYNITQDEAYTKLKSVFSGETESLKDLGVVMTQTALDSYALANGFGKTTKEMSEAEKVALRYSFVQKQLSAASGDFERTSDGWANQVRVLKLQFDSLKATIGQGLINALAPVLKVINTLIGKITKFAQALSDSLGKVFGWNYKENSGVSSELESGAESASGIANGIDDATKNAKKLKQQLSGIDELNVLSKSDDSDSADTSSGANIGTSSGMWSKTEGLFDGLKEEMKSFEKLFEDIKIGDWLAVGQDVSNVVTGIFDFFSNAISKVDWFELGSKIGSFLEGLDWVKILESIGNLFWEALSAGIELYAGAFDAAPIETGLITAVGLLHFTGLGSALWGAISNAIVAAVGAESGTSLAAALGGWIWKGVVSLIPALGTISTSVLVAAGAAIAVGIPTMFVGIYDAIKNGIDWLNGLIIPLGATVAGAGIGAIIGSLGGPIGTGLGSLIGLVIGLLTDGFILILQNAEKLGGELTGALMGALIGTLVPFGPIIGAVVGLVIGFIVEKIDDVKELFSGIGEWFGTNVIEPVYNFFYGLGLRIRQVFEGVWIIIKALWIIASSWFEENVIVPIVNVFAPIIEKISSIFTALWTKIKEIWGTVSSWLKEKVITPVENAFKKVCEKIGGFFSGMWDGIKKGLVNAMNAVIGGIEKAINFIVTGINKIITGFNKVVTWASKVAGVSWGGVSSIPKVSISRIPALAEGGYVKANTPRLAIIGDNRHHGEIVSPEDKLEQMALNAARLASKNQDNELMKQALILLKEQNELLLGILEKEIGISEQDVFNSVRRSADSYTRRTGNPAFNY